MITILSTTQGGGHGAEAVLCELLGAWPGGSVPLRVAAPRGSRVLDCAARLGFATVPLLCGRDALLCNANAMRKAFRNGDNLSLAHAWSARGFEFAWWLKHRFGVPAAATLHDHPSAQFHGKVRRRIMRYFADRLDGLATVSEAVAAQVRSDGYRLPVRVIRNGLGDIPSRKIPSTPVRIGFLGMYAAMKGGDIIAGWIESLLPVEGVAWHLYGGSARRGGVAAAERLAERYPERVRRRGVCDTETIFSEIDVLVHASVQFDSLPTVLIEAARAGIPCVASTAGGAPEIVNDGETGFLFHPSEPQAGLAALKCLLADPERRMEMGRAARRRFEQHFQAGVMAAAYRQFWGPLLTGPAVKGG